MLQHSTHLAALACCPAHDGRTEADSAELATKQKLSCAFALLQLSLLDTQRVWQQSFTAWCDALHRKVTAVQVGCAWQHNALPAATADGYEGC